MKTAVSLRGIALAIVLASGLLSRAQAQIIVNGGFETGFAGWTRADQVGSDGTFFIQSGTASPVNGFPTPPPPQGAQAAMTDAQAGGSHVLYQDFVLPTGIQAGSASFSLFINSGNNFVKPATLDWASTNQAGGLNLNQQARVDILTTSADPFSVAAADVLQNLYQTNPGDPLVSGYNTITSSFSPALLARQGQTLRLRFAEVDNVNFFNLGVDNVRVLVQPVPEPSLMAVTCSAALCLAWTWRRGGLRRAANRKQ